MIWSVDQSIRYHSWDWLYLALLTGLASFFPVHLPRLGGRDRGVVLTISTIFIFAAIFLYGPEVAAAISMVEAIVSTARSRTTRGSFEKALFNLFHLPPLTYATGLVFYMVYPASAPLAPAANHSWLLLFGSAALCSTIYFVLNAGAIALAIALLTGHSLRLTLRQSFLSAALTNLAEGSVAVVVFLNFEQTSLLGVGVALPTAAVIYYAYKINLARIDEANQHVSEVNQLYQATIEALAQAVDAKDQVTHGHIYRVQAMVVGLARYCGVKDTHELEGLKAASLLHDIGKLATPDYILNKPGALTDSEMETIRAHARVGAGILSSIPFPYPVVPFVLHHHEKWDGSGYPEGLKGEEIPLGARILSIIDCFDALVSDRPYRARLSRAAALDFICSEAGKSYDPMVVERLVEHIDELEAKATEVTEALEMNSEPVVPVSGTGDFPERSGMANTVFHDIASAHREVQALHEISQAVGRLLTVSETLVLLADKLKDLVPHDAACVFLADSNNDKLVCYHAAGESSDVLGSLEMRCGDGVSGWVAANRRSLLNVSPAPDLRLVDHSASFHSSLAVPLLLDNDVVGVITLYSHHLSAFRPNHLRLMENIAPHAATAINNAVIYDETQEDAYTDVLTGLPNLRYFKMFAEQELRRARNCKYPVTVIMMDLDRFKRINDENGHRIGDRVLIEIGHVLRNQLRKSDTCVRYGGDEFIGLLPGADKKIGQRLATQVREAVSGHKIRLDDNRSVQVGVSAGTATFPIDGERLEDLVAAADQAMYSDKARGKSVRSAAIQFPARARSA